MLNLFQDNNFPSLAAMAGPPLGFGEVDQKMHLHFLELCAGSHRLSDVAMEYRLRALAMDVPGLEVFLIESQNLHRKVDMLAQVCSNHVLNLVAICHGFTTDTSCYKRLRKLLEPN